MLMPKNLWSLFPLILFLPILGLCYLFLLSGKESLAEQSASIFYLVVFLTFIYSVAKEGFAKIRHPKD